MTFPTLQEAIAHLEKMGVTNQGQMVAMGIRIKEVRDAR